MHLKNEKLKEFRGFIKSWRSMAKDVDIVVFYNWLVLYEPDWDLEYSGNIIGLFDAFTAGANAYEKKI